MNDLVPTRHGRFALELLENQQMREFRGWTPGNALVNLLQCLGLLALAIECIALSVGRWTELLGLPLFVLGCFLAINRLCRAVDAFSLVPRLTTTEQGLDAGRVHLDWSELGLVHEAISPFLVTRYLELFDQEGRRRVKFCPARADFDTLKTLLEAGCTEPSPTAQKRLSATQGRTIIGMGLFFVVFGLGGLTCFAAGVGQHYLLNTRGVPAQATITRLNLSPNGMNRLITYKMPDSPVTHDAILDRAYWETLEVGDGLPVRTVPGRPEIARIPLYEEEQITPMVLLIVGVGGLGALLYGGTVIASGRRAMKGNYNR